MNENTHYFLFCLHFCLLRNFEIIRYTVKSLFAIQHIFVEVQLKKENLKNVFWAPKPVYTSLRNSLDMSLTIATFFMPDFVVFIAIYHFLLKKTYLHQKFLYAFLFSEELYTIVKIYNYLYN